MDVNATTNILTLPTSPLPIVSLTQNRPTILTTLAFPEDDRLIKREDDDDPSKHALHQAQVDASGRGTNDQKILDFLRHSILPFSDLLDPFAALPVTLNRFQEHLVTFYLQHYPKVTYGFSPLLRPHPVATNFSIGLSTPACFQVILARSALYRLSLSKYANDVQKKDLELAMMRHKGEALTQIRLLNAKPASSARKDNLVASIISIGTLDRRTGEERSSGMHFRAVRRILRVTGGPLAVKNLYLSRVMVFFECIYGTSPDSYIWDGADLPGLTSEFDKFLGRVWRIWEMVSASQYLRPCRADALATDGPTLKTGTGEQTSSVTRTGQTFYLEPGTPLHMILTRSPKPPGSAEQEPTAPQRLEQVTQLTCLITLAFLFVEHISKLQYASLTMAIHDLNRSVTKLCPKQQQSPHFQPGITPLKRSTSSSDSNPSVKAFSTHSMRAPPPPTPPGTAAAATASSSTRPSLATAPSNSSTDNTSTASPPPTRPQTTATTASPSSSKSHSAHTYPQHHPFPPDPSPDPTPINASNIMWLLHITDHSAEHGRRVWTAAAFAWVSKHLSWNTRERLGEWLVRFLEGRDVFAEQVGAGGGVGDEGEGEEEVMQGKGGQPREGVSEDEEKCRERGAAHAGNSAAAADRDGGGCEQAQQQAERKKETRCKEKRFKLDAWSFSYAS
ncbi:uncharacterized protein HMPREF1541_08277 [Cyphellophora europaea CBS 101466]|uniref:Uncharacterized protein n=1 Tax=Cyphellophora europaea (strain CBS 101466) TaxID=1220924 RepID=W2RLB5_CYPE1|nr:uncharacterized protein HMPREF1541_08277 [Cyphellophora europaea CBS 101466]ETN37286.1 hypothetical protein HMPREF1541_08277 [Cyphellophora europaea CBS 101466]